jgi:hypothetical protein
VDQEWIRIKLGPWTGSKFKIKTKKKKKLMFLGAGPSLKKVGVYFGD